MEFNKRWEAIRKNSFLTAVTVLVGGTAFAQAITVAVLPLLTRIYLPEDFSVLAVYASLLAILSVIGCLRLEIAIPLPESDEDAANLLVMSLCSATVFALVVLVAISTWNFWAASFFSQKKLAGYLWLLAPGVWLASTYSAVQFWAVRKKNFKSVTRTRVTQSSLGAFTQAGAGFLSFGATGLITGLVLSSGAGVYRLTRDAWQSSGSALRKVSLGDMVRVFKDYERFPRFSVLESLANNAGIHIPMLLIATLSLGPEAGYLLLAMRATAIPLALIGGAVAQVFLSNAANKYREGDLRKFTSNTIEGLLKAGVGPLFFIGIVAHKVCPFILGPGWERVGELVAFMTPWIVLQFLASPISMVMHVTGRQRAMLWLTVFGLILRAGSVILAMNFDIVHVSLWFAVSSAMFYLFCSFVFLRAAGIIFSDITAAIRRSAVIIAAWLFFGILIIYLIRAIS